MGSWSHCLRISTADLIPSLLSNRPRLVLSRTGALSLPYLVHCDPQRTSGSGAKLRQKPLEPLVVMSEFVFDPPLRLAGDVTVRTLDDAATFTRNYKTSRQPMVQDGVLHRLEAASSREEQRISFRDIARVRLPRLSTELLAYLVFDSAHKDNPVFIELSLYRTKQPPDLARPLLRKRFGENGAKPQKIRRILIKRSQR
jgi:hypothetical protein